MLFYLKLGFLNLLKNRRRSVKTIITVVIGLSACLLVQGFMSHTLQGLQESLINSGIGHFQIYRKGYLEYGNEEPYQYLITDVKAVLSELSKIPELKLIAPHLEFQGIVSSGEKDAIFLGNAGLSQQEQELNTLVTLKEGSFLNDQNPFEVVIGSGIARKLNVGIGDPVTLLAAMKDGGINAVDLEITGVVEGQIKNYNEVILMANLNTVQNLINIPNSVDRIILLLNEDKNQAKIEPMLKKICDELDLEHSDWRRLAGIQYTQPKLFYDLVYVLMMTIIVLVVIFSITNTLNLTMQERIREIGTIRSLGTTRLQVVKIFISESFLIGLIGGLAGILAGYGLAAVFNALGGVSIPPPPGHAKGYMALFKPDISQAFLLGMLFLVTSTLAGFYPAFRAAKLRIVDALRWL
jgi:putative ABC transport system permease protein